MIKSNIDYGVFLPVQEAGIAAPDRSPGLCGQQRSGPTKAQGCFGGRPGQIRLEDTKAERFNVPLGAPAAWLYLVHLFVSDFLKKTGIVVIPGVAFGSRGEGYVRIALVEDESILVEAVERVRKNFSFNP